MLTMLRLGAEREQLRVVDDQFGAPTTSVCLADTTFAAVRKVLGADYANASDWAGLYHMTCQGSTTWCSFARAILMRGMGDRAPEVVGISSEEYPSAAKRPKNSVLKNGRLYEKLGLSLPSWEFALDDALGRLSATAVTASS